MCPANDPDSWIGSADEGSMSNCIVFHMRILGEDDMSDLGCAQAPATELRGDQRGSQPVAAMTAVGLRDVTLRDGLQDEAAISTEAKLAIFDALVHAGVADLELTSFTRADRVPAMADADRLAHLVLARGDGPQLWGLVLNRHGTERAVIAGLHHLQFVLSVSEKHNKENAGRSVADFLVELQAITSLAADGRALVEVTLATAFGCPFDGPVVPARVEQVAEQVRGLEDRQPVCGGHHRYSRSERGRCPRGAAPCPARSR